MPKRVLVTQPPRQAPSRIEGVEPEYNDLIERYRELQIQIREPQKEMEEIKARLKERFGDPKLYAEPGHTHVTPAGASITLYQAEKEDLDEKYVRRVLTKEQLDRATIVKVSNCMRVS